MKPWKSVATATGPSGGAWRLDERDGVFTIRVNGRELMSSAQHGSEEAMARVGLAELRPSPGPGRPGLLPRTLPRVLIGGLGMGFTLRAALDRLPPEAMVTVAELSPAVVDWNRGPLAPLAGRPLEDPRVTVELGDVLAIAGRSAFDAILLDVDNGPEGLVRPGNRRLYGEKGIARFHRALLPAGVWVVWSAGSDAAFLDRLKRAGFDALAQPVSARPGSGARHQLFVARKRSYLQRTM